MHYRIEFADDTYEAATLPDAVRVLDRGVSEDYPGRITRDGETIVAATSEVIGQVDHRQPCPCDHCTEDAQQLAEQLKREQDIDELGAAEAREWFPMDEDHDENAEGYDTPEDEEDE